MRTAYVVEATRVVLLVTETLLEAKPYDTQRLSPEFLVDTIGPRSAPESPSVLMLRMRIQVLAVGRVLGVCMLKLTTKSVKSVATVPAWLRWKPPVGGHELPKMSTGGGEGGGGEGKQPHDATWARVREFPEG